MSIDMSDVVVIVPFGGGNVAELETQLRALAQSSDAEGLQVLVAVNSKVATLPDTSAIATPAVGIDVIHAHDRRGASFARNAGVQASHQSTILFCDADDEVSASWARSLAQEVSRTGGVASGPLDYDQLNESTLRWRDDAAHALPEKFGFKRFAPSCNLGISRLQFEAIGGWDENLAAGEDADLSWRAQLAGSSIAWAPNAVVHYRLRASLPETWRQYRSYGEGDRALLVKYASAGASIRTSTRAAHFLSLLRHVATSPFSQQSRFRAVARLAYLIGWHTG